MHIENESDPTVRAVLAGHADGHPGQIFRTGFVPLDAPPLHPAASRLFGVDAGDGLQAARQLTLAGDRAGAAQKGSETRRWCYPSQAPGWS